MNVIGYEGVSVMIMVCSERWSVMNMVCSEWVCKEVLCHAHGLS